MNQHTQDNKDKDAIGQAEKLTDEELDLANGGYLKYELANAKSEITSKNNKTAMNQDKKTIMAQGGDNSI